MSIRQNNLAPIILFVYNRLEHTMSTLESLSKNTLAKQSALWIFADGAKNDEDYRKTQEVRDYIRSLPVKGWFDEIIIKESSKNKGLAKSIIEGVTCVIDQHEKVIVLEDDLVTAPDFLEFMNKSLNFYKNKPSVGAISGYNPIRRENFPPDYEEDVYVTNRNCSIGWATWDYIWKEVDWEVRDYKNFERSFRSRIRFDESGSDRSKRLIRQVKYNLNSWSIRFGYTLFKLNKNVIYPKTSRLKHIGWDGSGTHSTQKNDTATQRFNSEIPVEPLDFILSIPEKDKKIVMAMKRVYSGGLLMKVESLLSYILY